MTLKNTAMVLPVVIQSLAMLNSPTVQPHWMFTTPGSEMVDHGMEQTHAS